MPWAGLPDVFVPAVWDTEYGAYFGMMEKKMETTIIGFRV